MKRALPFFALALLAGCVAIPPDPHGQQQAAIGELPAAIRLAADAWPQAHWWTVYADDQLDALIAAALGSNPGLDIARARIAEADAVLGGQRAKSGAEVSLDAGLNRQRYSANGLFPEPIGGNFFNDASVQLRASYDFDWWGKHRALVAAALGEANARRAEQAQAEQLLAASVAQSYFRLQSLWARKANLDAMAAVQEALVADKARRLAHGLARSDDEASAAQALGRLREQAAQLATEAARERENLRALSGNALPPLSPRAAATPPHALPARLGLELLARRPDLQAARYRVESALGQVDAARAAFYPDLNLVGAFGLDAISLGRLLQAGSRTLLLGTSLSLPLFDNGRLGNALAGVRAQRDAAIADYNQAVLNAVRDVAQDGVSVQGIEEQLAAHRAADAASAALLHTTQARLQQGLADQAALLQARMNRLQQQQTTLELQGAERQAEVALIKSLGGGFRATNS